MQTFKTNKKMMKYPHDKKMLDRNTHKKLTDSI